MTGRQTFLVVALCLVAVAGCSATDRPSQDALHALSVQATTTPTTVATGPTTTAPPCPVIPPSLRPQGPLPPPGAMAAGSFMATIQQRGRLIVGVDQNTLLFGYLNPRSGQIEGFDIDMLRQVAKAIFGDDGHNENTRIQFTAISSNDRIPFVQNDKVDIVAETMTINCARAKLVNFSGEYFHAGQRVLVRSDSNIKSSADLGGRPTCAARGSTSIANIADVTKTHASAPAVKVEVADWTDCLVKLQSGAVDAISTDDTILAGLAVQDPTTKIVGTKFTDEPYGMAIKLDHPEFVRFVNGVLDRVRADGTWAAIWNRWLGPVYGLPIPVPPTPVYGG
jgi:polar amino acid transport system substrate-binding protein